MRKRSFAVVATVALTAAAIHSQAGPTPTRSREPLRIAYVDLDRIAANSKAVQAKIDQVEQDLRTKQKAYGEKMKELRSLRARLRQQESVMSQAQIEQTKARIAKLEDDVKYLEFEYGKTLDDTSRNLIEPVLDDVLSAVRRVAEANKIDLVLRGDLVLFSSNRVDITDAIIRELDRSAGVRSTVAPGRTRPTPAAAGTRRTSPKATPRRK